MPALARLCIEMGCGYRRKGIMWKYLFKKGMVLK